MVIDNIELKDIKVELVKVKAELERVESELAEVKKRFGLDKQEAFLDEYANITLKEYAEMLFGRDCTPELTPNELLLAQKRGFVVVYGDSDDRVEFEGAVREAGHTNPLIREGPAGVLALSKEGKLLDEEYSDFDEGYARCMVFELSALT
jgi:hypothetical protein